MKHILHSPTTLIIIFVLFILAGCSPDIERSGIVVDRETNEPIAGVAIEIYMKHQRRDSLQQKVFTDNTGHFRIAEKRSSGLLFQLSKSGYSPFVSMLSSENDTTKLERVDK